MILVESPPPEELQRFVETEGVRWSEAVRKAGLAGTL
jgi:hypothetical protein